MAVKVQCPTCGRTSNIREAHLGRTIRCVKCQGTFAAETMDGEAVPEASATARDSDALDVPAEKAGRASATAEAAEDADKAARISDTHTAAAQETNRKSAAARPGHIGRFEVRARLGAGAFGTVYRAYDPQLDREVALKVPQGDKMESARQVERFLREAKAAARLRHPHIVPVYDAGHDGPHYFIASAFIKGRTLSKAVDSGDIDCAQAAQIVRELAEALAYAHELGIVHRDVKSSNVMLDDDGKAHLMDFGLAYDTSTPWWSGNAVDEKVVASTTRPVATQELTHDGAVVGTPGYMAPEQAKGKSGQALPASDQYSLGVILYELLCGELPFEGPVHIVLFNVIHEKPPAPHTHRKGVPPDLETICLKAMAKRPDQRYASCQEFADDLRRWQEGEPIKARHMGPWERLVRWCKREPKLAVAALLVACSLLGAAVASLVAAGKAAEAEQAERAKKEEVDKERIETATQRDAATDALAKLEASRKSERMLLRDKELEAEKARVAYRDKEEQAEKTRVAAKLAEDEVKKRLEAIKQKQYSDERVRHLLYDANTKLAFRDWDAARLPAVRNTLDYLDRDLRGWEWSFLDRLLKRPSLLELPHTSAVNAVAYNQDGKLLATVTDDGTLRVYEVDSKKQPFEVAPPGKVRSRTVTFSRSGLLAAAWDNGVVRLFDAGAGDVKEVGEFPAHKLPVTSLSFSPDGRHLATGSLDKTAKLWALNPRQGNVTAVPVPLQDGTLIGPVSSVLFSPKAINPNISAILLAATLGEPNQVRAWAFTPLGVVLIPVTVPSGHHLGINCMAFHRDCHEISVGSPSHTISTVRFKFGGVQVKDPEIYFLGGGHNDSVNGLAYPLKGEDCFVSASSDWTVKVWDSKRGVLLHTFKGHHGAVRGLAVNPDGTRLATASADNTVKIWDLTGNQDASILRFDDLPVQSVAFSPDKASGNFLALGSGWPNKLGGKAPKGKKEQGEVRVWDVASRKEVPLLGAKHAMGVTAVAFGWDGQRLRLASASHDRTVKIWDVASGMLANTLPEQPGAVHALAFSPDGKRLATGGENQPVQLWDPATGKRLSGLPGIAFPVYALAFHRDGRRLAVAGANREVIVRDVEGGEQKGYLGHQGEVRCVAFSPDGKRLAWSGADLRVRVWNLDLDKAEDALPSGHTDRIMGLAFSPDGLRLATASLDRAVKLWDVGTSQEILTLTALGTNAMGVAFSADGFRLAVADYYGSADLYDASPMEGPDPSPKKE